MGIDGDTHGRPEEWAIGLIEDNAPTLRTYMMRLEDASANTQHSFQFHVENSALLRMLQGKEHAGRFESAITTRVAAVGGGDVASETDHITYYPEETAPSLSSGWYSLIYEIGDFVDSDDHSIAATIQLE